MHNFNRLESEMLEAMLVRMDQTSSDALRLQLKSVRITSRENSGKGFFTMLEADHNSPPLNHNIHTGSIPAVWAQVEIFENVMTFVLFIENGYVTMFEGATVIDSTFNVDFANVSFHEIMA